MKKMKPMLPSLKAKKRYIAFEVISDKPIGRFSAVQSAIWDSCLALMGEAGAAKAAVWLLEDKWNEEKQKGIIRTGNKSLDDVKASLALVKKINSQDVIVRSIGVSGMLGKAYRNYVQ